MIKILVTGGLGYIGSHTVVELIDHGIVPVIVDNLANSELFILDHIQRITSVRPVFYEGDVCEKGFVRSVLNLEGDCKGVIHFAAHKSVSDSMRAPLPYFRNNIESLMVVLEEMIHFGIRSLVFSSSATVYGQPDVLPVDEHAPMKKALSAYGSSKQIGEEIIEKTAVAHQLKCMALRYFNPAGAHSSALLGELPRGVPNNLVPYITQAAIGKRERLTVFGTDYDTPDGSCIRDFIHVSDLAAAHVLACKRAIAGHSHQPFETFNVGTGRGTSVLEMIAAFERVAGRKLPYTIGARRAGDSSCVYADATQAHRVLNWTPRHTLDGMLMSAWQWENALARMDRCGV